ncbi:hypothetical protein HYS31_06430 [Candidatus Woesearchaeota archaeon]|nr:hypothetical protein [Candidatus Woesearchaeota archaeon]
MELLIFAWIYSAMISMSFWESYVEGRNPWDKRKLGWKIHLGKKFVLPAYHFYVFLVMWPLLLTLPFVIHGWNARIFGIIASAYFSGMVIEDFMWYVVNPAVKLKEFYTQFSDYYPWLRIYNKKIIPWAYVFAICISILSWHFLWRQL